MKIRQIPAALNGKIGSESSIDLDPNLQLLFGFVDADTTAIRNSIRHFFFGRETDVSGLDSDRTELGLDLVTGSTTGTRFVDGLRLKNSEIVPEWKRILQEIDYETYTSFFDLNFGQGEKSGAQLAYQLRQRFQAPFGDVSIPSTNKGRQELISSLKEEIAEVNREIASCRGESGQLHKRLEDLKGHHVRPYEFEFTQKQTLLQRIEGLQDKLAVLRSHVCELEEQIEFASRSVVINDRRDSASSVSRAKSTNDQLLEQIQRVDSQIERWKSVKQDVDSRLSGLKEDLLTNRVSEFDATVDELREIVRASEGMVLELIEQTAKHDSANLKLNSLLEYNHQLCDSLTGLQESWREDLLKGEMDSLKRCSAELDGYVSRLVSRRTKLDPANLADSGKGYCQCRTHGLESRSNRDQVESLNEKMQELLLEIDVSEKRLLSAQAELDALNSVPDIHHEIELVRQRIQACNQDHSLLQDRKDALLNQLKDSLSDSKSDSRLIHNISEFVSSLSGGAIQRVYLQEQGQGIDLVTKDGDVLDFEEADFLVRNKVRMAISLGCCKLLAQSGFRMPLVWEDAFVGFQRSDLHLAIGTLRHFSDEYGQVILLTNNFFVKQWFESQNQPCSEIPDRYAGDALADRQGRFEVKQSYSSKTDWSEVNRHFDLAAMDQYGTEVLQKKRQKIHGRRESSGKSSSVQAGESRSNEVDSRSDHQVGEQTGKHRFYLELSSRVEAAPTIGPKTAERLEKIGVCVVADLIEHDPEWIASELDHPRIKATDVSSWQKQALLVCQVPNLRGHDAQLLVACGIEDATSLAELDAESLFEIIGPFAKSKEGKKILRGSTEPDLEEVTDWIHWALNQRSLPMAA